MCIATSLGGPGGLAEVAFVSAALLPPLVLAFSKGWWRQSRSLRISVIVYLTAAASWLTIHLLQRWHCIRDLSPHWEGPSPSWFFWYLYKWWLHYVQMSMPVLFVSAALTLICSLILM